MRVLDMPAVTVSTSLLRELEVLQVNDALWRVTRRSGDVVGYVEGVPSEAGIRFRAKRYLPLGRRFLAEGEFWTLQDALECFRPR